MNWLDVSSGSLEEYVFANGLGRLFRSKVTGGNWIYTLRDDDPKVCHATTVYEAKVFVTTKILEKYETAVESLKDLLASF